MSLRILEVRATLCAWGVGKNLIPSRKEVVWSLEETVADSIYPLHPYRGGCRKMLTHTPLSPLVLRKPADESWLLT